MVLEGRPRLGADGDGALTMAQAGAKVDDAIYLGELAAQHAPSGHPIFAAIADAKEAKDWIDEQIPFFSGGGSPALPTVTAKVDGIVSEVYDAMAQIQDPGEGVTLYNPPTSPIPWAWLGAGAVALAGSAFLLTRKRRAA